MCLRSIAMQADAMHPTTVEVLNQIKKLIMRVIRLSYYRMLVNKKYFKYITIDPSIYEADDLCFPPILLEKLPPFPPSDWNYGRISQTVEHATPYFVDISRKAFPFITQRWHPKSYDYLSLKIGERLRANVYMASSLQFAHPVVAKFARFYWEIEYYAAETRPGVLRVPHEGGPNYWVPNRARCWPPCDHRGLACLQDDRETIAYAWHSARGSE